MKTASVGRTLFSAAALALLAHAGFAAEAPAAPARIPLWPDTAPVGDGTREKTDAAITVFLPQDKNPARTAIVICPGGGYGGLVRDHEGTLIAQWLNGHGIAGVVLDYRLPRGRHAVPLLDAQRALRLVRANAQAWGIDPKRVGIMGFSAGGHLASTAGTHFDAGNPKADDPSDRPSCRPDFMLLVYPVITFGEKGHGGTRQNLLGPNPSAEQILLYSNERQVTAQTPPAFMAHAKDDTAVPPENSQNFCDALKAHGVAAEYLELASGGHGLNGYKGPMWDAWQKRSLEWLAEQKLVSPAPAGVQ